MVLKCALKFVNLINRQRFFVDRNIDIGQALTGCQCRVGRCSLGRQPEINHCLDALLLSSLQILLRWLGADKKFIVDAFE